MPNTITSLSGDFVSLAVVFRALADDVEQLSNTDELDEHSPTEGRVAEVTSGGDPPDIYIATGDAWLDVRATVGLSAVVQRTTTQDLTAGDAPAPTDPGVQAAHDGSGTPPAGTYAADPPNNQWVGADDRTSGTTIAY